MAAPDATCSVKDVKVAPNGTNVIGNPSNEQKTLNINNKVSGSYTYSRRESGDEAPIRNPGIKQRLRNPTEQPWLTLAIIALGLGLPAMAIVLGLRYAPDHSNATADRAEPPTTATAIGSSSIFPDSGASTPASSPHSPISIPTPVDTIPSLIESMASMTSTTTPTQASSTRPQPLTAVSTPAPTVLTPGAACTTDAQCTPNICYTEPTATYCCGPTIQGCPGWPCSDIGHRDCKDPFTCNFAASTCG